MSTFDKRQEGFESKFAHDEELRFKATARRNKLLGLWAAGLMGKEGDDADHFAHGGLAVEHRLLAVGDGAEDVAQCLWQQG